MKIYKNEYTYIFILLVLFSLNVNAGQTILIKYSFNDCVACNVNLYNIAKTVSTPLLICFKNIDTKNNGYDEIFNFLNAKSIKTVVSDSLYYAFDSTERSKIYKLDNGKVVKSDYLKTANLQNYLLLNDHPDSANIIATHLSNVAVSDNFIYLAQNEDPYILIVSRQNLKIVADTLHFYTDAIRHSIFQKLYGNMAEQKLAEIEDAGKQVFT